MAVRNPAEWQWARYNFWTNELDRDHVGGRWTSAQNYRSPELFHELVAAGNRTIVDSIVASYAIDWVRRWLQQAEDANRVVGAGNLLLLAADTLAAPETHIRIGTHLNIANSFKLGDARVNSGATFRSRGSGNKSPGSSSSRCTRWERTRCRASDRCCRRR